MKVHVEKTLESLRQAGERVVISTGPSGYTVATRSRLSDHESLSEALFRCIGGTHLTKLLVEDESG